MEYILAVDDELQNLELFKHIMEREGIEVCCVMSGEEALPKLTEGTFSLMITDLNMTGLDGIELSRKALEIAPQMPIIMCTGNISPEIIRLAMETGISEVLAKPFNPIELLETIRGLMGKRRKWASSTG